MFSNNRRPLGVNDCIHMAMSTQNIHLRTYWTNTAKAMLDAAPTPAPRNMGLTIQSGSLYRHEARQANNARFERTQRHGVSL